MSPDVQWIQLPLDGRRNVLALPALYPLALVHCAAVSTVAECDENRKLAFQVNVEATRRLAGYAEERGACFIFISTDLVFDGTKGNYTEKDTPHPLTWYAETKRLAEEAVAEICTRYYIIRTALMYGSHDGRWIDSSATSR
jgi:dTDP-4-dehydrorhamnose reductase